MRKCDESCGEYLYSRREYEAIGIKGPPFDSPTDENIANQLVIENKSFDSGARTVDAFNLAIAQFGGKYTYICLRKIPGRYYYSRWNSWERTDALPRMQSNPFTFNLGSIHVGLGVVLTDQAALDAISYTHAKGGGGTYSGTGIATTNAESIASRLGPIRSRFIFLPTDPGVTIPSGSPGLVVALEVCTYIFPDGPFATVAYAEVEPGP